MQLIDKKFNIAKVVEGDNKENAINVDSKIPLRVNVLKEDETLSFAQRRFVYCWERPDEEGEWIARGLLMTDDEGFLFDFQRFVNDFMAKGDDSPLKWKINKYNRKNKKWEDADWNFFGGTEDLIAFQKWVGSPHFFLNIEQQNDQKDMFKNSVLFVKNTLQNGSIYQFSFYANDKYICRFKARSEYFFMFCPPDIIDPQHFFEKKAHNPGPNGFEFWSLTYSDEDEWRSSKLWEERVQTGKLCLEWLERTYIVREDDTLSAIGKKLNIPWQKLYEINKDVIGPDSGKINPGMKLEIFDKDSVPLPVTTFGAFFGKNCNRKISDYKNFSMKITKLPANHPSSYQGNYAIINLPVTLEEHLSILSYHTVLLDLHFQQIIESTKPFMEASGKLAEINDLLELMKLYPGYKNFDFDRTVWLPPSVDNGIAIASTVPFGTWRKISYKFPYKDKIIPDANDQKKLKENLEKLRKIEKDIAETALSDKNPVFKCEKKDVIEEAEIINDILQGSFLFDLLERLNEWLAYTAYTKDSETYPYRMRFDSNELSSIGSSFCQFATAPVLFRVIQDTHCTMLALDSFSFPKSKDESIAENFYRELVEPFDEELAQLYDIHDSKNGLTKKFLKAAEKQDLIPKGEYKVKDISRPDYGQKKIIKGSQKTVLQVVFHDTLFGKILPNIWNNQTGLDSYITAIIKIATRYRSASILIKCKVDKIWFAYYQIKIIAGRLIRSKTSIQQISNELEAGVVLFAKRKNNIVRISKEKLRLMAFKRWEKQDGKKASAAQGKINKFVSAVGIYFTIREIVLFSGKAADKKHKLTPDDWVDLIRSLHGGGLAITGLINVSKFSKISSLKIIGTAVKTLKLGTVVFFWYDAVANSIQAWNYHEEGEMLLSGLRWTQAALCGCMAVAAFCSLVPIIGTVIVVAIALVEAGIMMKLVLRKGIENTIKELNSQLIKMPLFSSEVITIYDESSKYNLQNCLTFINIPEKSYSMDKDLINVWKERIKLINSLKYWNLDIIKAGAALHNKGYKMEDIAYVCMEIDKSISSKMANEKYWIELFANLGFFNIKETQNPYTLELARKNKLQSEQQKAYNNAIIKKNKRMCVSKPVQITLTNRQAYPNYLKKLDDSLIWWE